MHTYEIQGFSCTIYHVSVEPKKSIKIVTKTKRGETVREFRVGDKAEYDSYNLSYVSEITSIGPKTIGFGKRGKRLGLETFCWRNWNFDEAETAKRNAIESMNI